MKHREILELSTVQNIPWSGKYFAECYIQMKGRHRGRGYLLLCPILNDDNIQPQLHDQNYRSRIYPIDVDGIPWLAIECRHKYLNLISNCSGLECRKIYYQLTMILTDEDVKRYYYPIWLINNNIKNVSRNYGILRQTKRNKSNSDGYIHQLTKGSGSLNSIRAHSRSSII